ncbi:MAG: hypothetical protein ACREJB_07440 [Planctomycetaceae bacterium]
MGAAGEHVFNVRTASPALTRAMTALAECSGHTLAELDQTTLGEAYRLAVETYGDELPDFWRVWNDWNTMPDQPAEMGEL